VSTISKPAKHLEQSAFYLSGRMQDGEMEPKTPKGLVPAPLAPFRVIENVRHDYPLVLFAERREPCFDSLSNVVKQAVSQVLATEKPGPSEAQALPWHAARMERAVRVASYHGGPESLRERWMAVAESLEPERGGGFLKAALSLGSVLPDAELVACDRNAPHRVVRHLWQHAQHRRTRNLAVRLDRLLLGLRGILEADFVRSRAGRTPDRLMASVGSLHSDQFDFEVMSQLLASRSPDSLLAAHRRRRIEEAIAVLERQEFVSIGGSGPSMAFEFDSCAEALRAFSERMPRAMELARAVSVAELDIDGAYREAVHDRLFAELGSAGFTPENVDFLPTTLVSLSLGEMSDEEHDALDDLFATRLPFKVLVQIDDLVEGSPLVDGHFSLGAKARRFAWSALAGSGIFVCQTTNAGLFLERHRMARAFAFDGPALLCVYSGANPSSTIPPYLAAAAASEARVFPSFAFDPSAGPDWASRFSLEGNPQPGKAWPTHAYQWEDADLQTVTESAPFTAVEFAMTDSRLEGHFALAAKDTWDDSQVPIREALERPSDFSGASVPYVQAVDEQDRLQRMLVDVRLLTEARRCALAWRSLQELGGIENSHAARQLEAERAMIEQRLLREQVAAPAASESETPTEVAAPPVQDQAIEAEAPKSDEPYIETARCTTCNECTGINPKMFAYNENKQAFIKDPSAGTYAQLVEAAESCQVSIIHPGKPKNPNEPGLDELLKRAAPFL